MLGMLGLEINSWAGHVTWNIRGKFIVTMTWNELSDFDIFFMWPSFSQSHQFNVGNFVASLMSKLAVRFNRMF